MALNADPAVLRSAGAKATALQQLHGKYLGDLLLVQDDLSRLVRGPGGGPAIQAAMSDANQKGTSLGATLQILIDTLVDTAGAIDNSDVETAGRVNGAVSYGGGKVDLTGV